MDRNLAQGDKSPPPAHLSERSQQLWREVVDAGRVSDPEQMALLRTALEARDRADAAREEVERDGMTFTVRGMVRMNPAAKVENDARTLFGRIWASVLRLDYCEGVNGGIDWEAEIARMRAPATGDDADG
ncbi:MAG: hypothetical protein JSV65_04045 [Armatimonadota bacterium]|nr:MAG: hypothetical protein JSV65_04045 [Armatimonadota bacterium]